MENQTIHFEDKFDAWVKRHIGKAGYFIAGYVLHSVLSAYWWWA